LLLFSSRKTFATAATFILKRKNQKPMKLKVEAFMRNPSGGLKFFFALAKFRIF